MSFKRVINKLGYDQVKTYYYNEFIKSVLKPFIFKGQISLEESRFLMSLVDEANKTKGPIVEIGTLFGRSTQVIVLAKQKNKKFITVDKFKWNPLGLPPEKHFILTKKILSEAVKKYNTELKNMDKDDFYMQYNDEIPSMVFFDADHSYEATLKDLIWAKELGVKIICGHDYSNDMPGVLKAVNEISGGKPKKVCGSLFVL